MDNLENLVQQSIDDNSHYLLKALLERRNYFDGFEHAIRALESKVDENKINRLLTEKLQIRKGKFREQSFVQMACETTVNSYLAEHYSQSFQYEPRCNPSNSMTVECSFEYKDFRYNVEVKCPDLEETERQRKQDANKLSALGRLSSAEELVQFVDLLEQQRRINDVDVKPFVAIKNNDNKMKDFLCHANAKFNPKNPENEINIVAVCCADPMDMQQWFSYLGGSQGLFTEESFGDRLDYCKVDLVFLTNLFHRHYLYFDKVEISDNWALDGALSLVFSNPFAEQKKGVAKWNFLDVFPNRSIDFYNYQKSKPQTEIEGLERLAMPVLSFIVYGLEEKQRTKFFGVLKRS